MNDYHPEHIWMLLMDAIPKYSELNDPEMLLANGFGAEVHVHPTYNIFSLDLRFIVGTTVHLIGNEDRLANAVKAIKRFKPKAVYLPSGEMA
jgi:hypothetical protein